MKNLESYGSILHCLQRPVTGEWHQKKLIAFAIASAIVHVTGE